MLLKRIAAVVVAAAVLTALAAVMTMYVFPHPPPKKSLFNILHTMLT